MNKIQKPEFPISQKSEGATRVPSIRTVTLFLHGPLNCTGFIKNLPLGTYMVAALWDPHAHAHAFPNALLLSVFPSAFAPYFITLQLELELMSAAAAEWNHHIIIEQTANIPLLLLLGCAMHVYYLYLFINCRAKNYLTELASYGSLAVFLLLFLLYVGIG